MNRPRRDIDDLDETLFDREEAARRREQRLADRAVAAERAAMLDEQDRILKARAKAAFVDAGRELIFAEYANAGLVPPPGMLVSLQLLLRLGWCVESISGANVLVAPPPQPKHVPRGECS